MTEHKQTEETLRKANESLDLRIQERTTQLAQVDGQLQVAERRQTEQQLRALAARLQRVREEERALIAREIHDELGQALTAMKMDLSWVVQKLPETEKRLREKIHSTLQLVDDTVQAVRRIASELRPGLLDDLGLSAALEWQAQEFQARAGTRCVVNLPVEDVVLDPERSIAIFRIFQETLTNVARHAAATRVEVRLRESETELVLEVRDNGKGIDPQEIDDPKSLGLLGMRERALLLGGQFEVSGCVGKGTTVTVRIPVPSSGAASGAQG
jgi:signal transduction histidine kinase